jgi:hypothetical protein
VLDGAVGVAHRREVGLGLDDEVDGAEAGQRDLVGGVGELVREARSSASVTPAPGPVSRCARRSRSCCSGVGPGLPRPRLQHDVERDARVDLGGAQRRRELAVRERQQGRSPPPSAPAAPQGCAGHALDARDGTAVRAEDGVDRGRPRRHR